VTHWTMRIVPVPVTDRLCIPPLISWSDRASTGEMLRARGGIRNPNLAGRRARVFFLRSPLCTLKRIPGYVSFDSVELSRKEQYSVSFTGGMPLRYSLARRNTL